MKRKKLLTAIAGIVLLAGGGAVSYFYPFASSPADAAVETPPEPAGVVKLDPFLTNIADERRARVEVVLAVAPISRSEQVQSDALLIAKLRDKILTMLAARSYEDLSSPEGKEAFRNKVRATAQDLISDGEVQEALFVDFVIQ